jgi:small conductance mechanosensitive channel
MSELWVKIESHLPAWGAHLLAVAIILLVGWLFSRYLIGWLFRALVRVGGAPGAVSFLANTVRAVVLCAVILSVLQQIGVETTSMLALLGAGGAALVLSLQGFMVNFAAGMVLLGERLMRLGDTIEVGDVRGRVVEMQSFHVIVETAERVRVSVPNGTLMSTPFRNHSLLPTRRVQWLLPLPGGIDLAAVKEALRARLRDDARILAEPAPALFLREWAPDKVTLAVQAWTATPDAQAVQDQLLEELGKVVEKHVGTRTNAT